MSLQGVPEEILTQIFTFLKPSIYLLKHLSLVCKSWYSLTTPTLTFLHTNSSHPPNTLLIHLPSLLYTHLLPKYHHPLQKHSLPLKLQSSFRTSFHPTLPRVSREEGLIFSLTMRSTQEWSLEDPTLLAQFHKFVQNCLRECTLECLYHTSEKKRSFDYSERLKVGFMGLEDHSFIEGEAIHLVCYHTGDWEDVFFWIHATQYQMNTCFAPKQALFLKPLSEYLKSPMGKLRQKVEWKIELEPNDKNNGYAFKKYEAFGNLAREFCRLCLLQGENGKSVDFPVIWPLLSSIVGIDLVAFKKGSVSSSAKILFKPPISIQHLSSEPLPYDLQQDLLSLYGLNTND